MIQTPDRVKEVGTITTTTTSGVGSSIPIEYIRVTEDSIGMYVWVLTLDVNDRLAVEVFNSEFLAKDFIAEGFKNILSENIVWLNVNGTQVTNFTTTTGFSIISNLRRYKVKTSLAFLTNEEIYNESCYTADAVLQGNGSSGEAALNPFLVATE